MKDGKVECDVNKFRVVKKSAVAAQNTEQLNAQVFIVVQNAPS